jgi:phytoene dehydrogenase-like protein
MDKYDVIIIGAGMSGIAASIRLSMYGKKVCICEQHSRVGGLNSYYYRNNLLIDTGLHAMTNFSKKDDRNSPFGKILKQLRIPYQDFDLIEQNGSQIVFPRQTLNFSNDIEQLTTEILEKFPKSIDEFKLLLSEIQSSDATNLTSKYCSTRERLNLLFSDQQLIEMLLFPILIYGSSWKNDIDWNQFVIMFRSIFLEGFCRPRHGIKGLLEILTTKAVSNNVEIKLNTKVLKITSTPNESVVETNCGTMVANKIFSSAGLIETNNLINATSEENVAGEMAFTEAIFKSEHKHSNTNSIIFFNTKNNYNYAPSEDLIDSSSAVICFPDNFKNVKKESFNQVRITNISNFQRWNNLSDSDYREAKKAHQIIAQNFLEQNGIVKSDLLLPLDFFTPKTIQRYTGRHGGAIYGATKKHKDGRTQAPNIFIIGTDQGFLGITGAMLSGISMANLHGLMD